MIDKYELEDLLVEEIGRGAIVRPKGGGGRVYVDGEVDLARLAEQILDQIDLSLAVRFGSSQWNG